MPLTVYPVALLSFVTMMFVAACRQKDADTEKTPEEAAGAKQTPTSETFVKKAKPVAASSEDLQNTPIPPTDKENTDTIASAAHLIEYSANEIEIDSVVLTEDISDNRVKKWIARRKKNAETGKPELVRIPMAHRSMGWGCSCPFFLIGNDTSQEGAAWLEVQQGPHSRLPSDVGRDGYVRVVEGYFTGKDTLDKVESEGEIISQYTLHDFYVIRSRPYRNEEDDVLKVLLSGDATSREIPAMDDDRPWLVIVASIPYGIKKASDQVARLIQELKSKGYENAAYFDSRSSPLLFCCFHVVVADRYQTSDDAQNTLKTLRPKGFKRAYVRKGW